MKLCVVLLGVILSASIVSSEEGLNVQQQQQDDMVSRMWVPAAESKPLGVVLLERLGLGNFKEEPKAAGSATGRTEEARKQLEPLPHSVSNIDLDTLMPTLLRDAPSAGVAAFADDTPGSSGNSPGSYGGNTWGAQMSNKDKDNMKHSNKGNAVGQEKDKEPQQQPDPAAGLDLDLFEPYPVPAVVAADNADNSGNTPGSYGGSAWGAQVSDNNKGETKHINTRREIGQEKQKEPQRQQQQQVASPGLDLGNSGNTPGSYGGNAWGAQLKHSNKGKAVGQEKQEEAKQQGGDTNSPYSFNTGLDNFGSAAPGAYGGLAWGTQIADTNRDKSRNTNNGQPHTGARLLLEKLGLTKLQQNAEEEVPLAVQDITFPAPVAELEWSIGGYGIRDEAGGYGGEVFHGDSRDTIKQDSKPFQGHEDDDDGVVLVVDVPEEFDPADNTLTLSFSGSWTHTTGSGSSVAGGSFSAAFRLELIDPVGVELLTFESPTLHHRAAHKELPAHAAAEKQPSSLAAAAEPAATFPISYTTVFQNVMLVPGEKATLKLATDLSYFTDFSASVKLDWKQAAAPATPITAPKSPAVVPDSRPEDVAEPEPTPIVTQPQTHELPSLSPELPSPSHQASPTAKQTAKSAKPTKLKPVKPSVSHSASDSKSKANELAEPIAIGMYEDGSNPVAAAVPVPQEAIAAMLADSKPTGSSSGTGAAATHVPFGACAKRIPRGLQCGGTSGSCWQFGGWYGEACRDEPFTGVCCASGTDCVRKSEEMWVCAPKHRARKLG